MFDRAAQDFRIEFQLVAKVVVHQRNVDVCTIADIAYRCAVIAAVGEDNRSGLQQPGTRV